MTYRNKRVTYSAHSNHAARAAHARGEREFRTYDTSYIQPKKSKAPVIVALVAALAVVAIAALLIMRSCAPDKVELLPQGEQVVVVVEQGESAMDIGASLEKARLVASSDDFVNLVTKKNATASLIPGTYAFTGGMGLDEILQALVTGPAATGSALTIPEGFKLSDIAARVEQVTDGRVTADQFKQAASDASVYASEFSFLESVGTNSLEGFLFPKTYNVTAADDAQSIVRMMLSQFEKEIAGLNWEAAREHGLNLYDAVKLASIVEKEAGPENRATVASVFYNRLASERPYLESDATTAYEVGHEPTADEVHAETPYSTYTNAGLPPTPICSPSRDCLKAVCAPESTNYLFFYFEPDASGKMVYHFSETYEQHQDVIAAS